MGRMDVYFYVVMMSICLFNVYISGALIAGHVLVSAKMRDETRYIV